MSINEFSSLVNGQQRHFWADAIPTTGDFLKGDIIWNTAPAATSACIGWICTVAGAPGTLLPFGGLSPAPVTWADAAPVAGAHVLGEIVYNNAPASAESIGWVCTVAGTPGTWKAFGTIA